MLRSPMSEEQKNCNVFNKILIKEIKEKYLNKNFGSLSKSSLDLIVFHAYMEQIRSLALPTYDQYVSAELGLTISRVRNLKEKESLIYEISGYDYVKEFKNRLSFAKISKNNHDDDLYVKIPIQEIILKNFVQNKIAELDLIEDVSLNSSLIQLNFDSFLYLSESIINNNPNPREKFNNAKYLKDYLNLLISNEKNPDKVNSFKQIINSIETGMYKTSLKDILRKCKPLALSLIGLFVGKCVEESIDKMMKKL